MSTQINFYLESLNVEIDSLKATLTGAEDVSFNSDVVAELELTLSEAQNLFRFQSDAIDVDNVVADDLKYKLFYTTDSTLIDGVPETVLSPDWLVNTLCTGTDNDDPVYLAGTQNATNRGVAYDYVRYLAYKLFNTHLGVDLFDNETEVREGLIASAKIGLDSVLTAISDLNGGEYVDASINYTSQYDNTEYEHPSYSILKKIIFMDPARLSDLTPYFIEGETDGSADPATYPTFKMPLAVDDTLQFKLKINAESTQADVINSTTLEIPVREYRIVVNIVADPE